MPQNISKKGQHKQNKAEAAVLDAREQLALLRHSAADWLGWFPWTYLSSGRKSANTDTPDLMDQN